MTLEEKFLKNKQKRKQNRRVKQKMFEPTAPVLKGIIQIPAKTSTDKPQRIGDVSLWKFEKVAQNGENTKPSFKGNITINGTTYKISLWDN